MSLVCHLGAPRASPGQLDAPSMTQGHCGLVRDCVWSSGDALAGPGGPRRRLLDLKTNGSTLKIDDFSDFPNIFTTGSAPG